MKLAMGAPGMQEIVVIAAVLAMLGLQIWAIIHCIKDTRLSDTNRIIGVVLIAVLGIIGALIYLFIPRQSPDQSAD